MYIIAGLGNIGLKYKNTRHNMGFNAIDVLAKRNGLKFTKKRFCASVAEGVINGQRAVLLKPTTYMNRSGESLSAAYSFYKPDPQNIIVLYDDIDLAPGRLRIRKSGSAGTHNGMRSIVSALKTYGFMRIRIGIGKNNSEGDLADYVLKKLSGSEKKLLDEACENAAKAVEVILSDGIDAAMNEFNSK